MIKEYPSNIDRVAKGQFARFIARRVRYVLESHLEIGNNDLLLFSKMDIDNLREDLHLIVDQVFDKSIEENNQ